MNLRDGVKSVEIKMSSETMKLGDFVRDKDKSLIDRLESFEDIINIEVGDTGLTRAKTLEREFDIRQLYIKYEGDNPTGTQKDRIAFAQVYDAIRRDYDTIVATMELRWRWLQIWPVSIAKYSSQKVTAPNGSRKWKDLMPKSYALAAVMKK